MAAYMLVRHKVRDFATWKKVYDDHQPKRVEARLTDRRLLRNAYDPNEVIILFETADRARAQAFAESADLRETMERAGVVDRPDVYFLDE